MSMPRCIFLILIMIAIVISTAITVLHFAHSQQPIDCDKLVYNASNPMKYLQDMKTCKDTGFNEFRK